MRYAQRVAIVLALGGLMSALVLSVLLLALSNRDSGQPLLADLSLRATFWTSAGFSLFTVPITFAFGAPLYLLYHRLHLLRVWVCALTGGLVAISFPYGFRTLGAGVSLDTEKYSIRMAMAGGELWITQGSASGFNLRAARGSS